MSPALQHVFRRARLKPTIARIALERAPIAPPAARPASSSICLRCQWRAFSSHETRQARISTRLQKLQSSNGTIRPFSRSAKLRREQPSESSPRPASPAGSSTTVHEAPAESLPSHVESQKWTLTKRLNATMDSLLARLALASHEINVYTGTDYSGIEALRREIQGQEALVRTRHGAVLAAKAAFDDAQALQLKSQKEVVALLERKNNWASEDLERYMSLIRSEHANEQAVQATRDALLGAERALEEARTRLERRERERYHEEQIWSDTIRRNSTWITFGLMGFNALLLLVNIGVFEPWRRKRMVREITGAIGVDGPSAKNVSGIEKVIDKAVMPAAPTPEDVERIEREEALAAASAADDFVGGAVASEAFEEAADEALVAVDSTAPKISTSAEPKISVPLEPQQAQVDSIWTQWTRAIHDLFSEQLVSVRKRDITVLAFEGVAAGAGIVGFVVLLLRPR